MKSTKRFILFAPFTAIVALALIACGPQQTSKPAAPVAPAVVQQSSMPPAPAQQPASVAGGFAAPAPGPNLLAKTWSERLGIIVSDYKAPTGKPLLNPK